MYICIDFKLLHSKSKEMKLIFLCVLCIYLNATGDFGENVQKTASSLLGFQNLIEIDTFPR